MRFHKRSRKRLLLLPLLDWRGRKATVIALFSLTERNLEAWEIGKVKTSHRMSLPRSQALYKREKQGASGTRLRLGASGNLPVDNIPYPRIDWARCVRLIFSPIAFGVLESTQRTNVGHFTVLRSSPESSLPLSSGTDKGNEYSGDDIDMTREFTNMDILRDSELVIFSHSTTFTIFLLKSRRFSFQVLAKFEGARTGSGVGFLRLTAVWLVSALARFWLVEIGLIINEQGTEYEYSISIELKNGARHLKEHPKISKFTKFENYWFKRKGMVRF